MREHLDKIFDPYFSTKPMGAEKGLGLGLSICHSIIAKHGGQIRVASERGKGTVIHIFLPVAEEKEGVEEVKAPVPLISSGWGRVLVMDDEEMIRSMTVKLLQRLGLEAESAAEGQEAVDRYRKALEEGAPYEVVILDLTVRGGMRGLEAYQKLIEIDPQAKAIISSGYSDDPVVTTSTSMAFEGPWLSLSSWQT